MVQDIHIYEKQVQKPSKQHRADCLHAEILECTSYGHKLYENESECTHEVIEPRLLGVVLQQLDWSDVITTGRERQTYIKCNTQPKHTTKQKLVGT